MTYNPRLNRLQSAAILAITLDRTLVDCVEESWFTGNARAAFLEIQATCAGNGNGTVKLDELLRSEFGIARRRDEKVKDAVLRRLQMSAEKRLALVEYQRKLLALPKKGTE